MTGLRPRFIVGDILQNNQILLIHLFCGPLYAKYMPSKKILVSDNDEKNLKLLQFLIRSMGHEPIAACDDGECLRIAADVVPDLILLDVNMPEMTGIDAIKALRSNEKTKDIPSIAVTSHSLDAQTRRLIDEHFSYIITKPISTKAFSDIVKKALGS